MIFNTMGILCFIHSELMKPVNVEKSGNVITVNTCSYGHELVIVEIFGKISAKEFLYFKVKTRIGKKMGKCNWNQKSKTESKREFLGGHLEQYI